MTLWEAMGQTLAALTSPVAVTLAAALVLLAAILATLFGAVDAILMGFDRFHLIPLIGGPLVAFLSLSVVVWANPLTYTNVWP